MVTWERSIRLRPQGNNNVPTLDNFFFRDGKVARYWHLTAHFPILVGIEAEVRIGDQVAKLD